MKERVRKTNIKKIVATIIVVLLSFAVYGGGYSEIYGDDYSRSRKTREERVKLREKKKSERQRDKLFADSLKGTIERGNVDSVYTNHEDTTNRRKSYFEAKIGYQIGGTVPFPLPAQMRKINGFAPLGNISVQLWAVIPVGRRWELMSGLKVDRKGMTSKATVKDYSMSIQDEDGGTISGRWTGDVTMTADQWYLSIPVDAAFYITERGKVRVGAFFSFLTGGKFNGEVYNGYLREGDPTGAKIEVDDKPQSFDFSGDLRRYQWGVTLGGEWNIYKRLVAFVDLDWGFKNIFVDEFKTITFDMFPIYGTIGVGYAFK